MSWLDSLARVRHPRVHVDAALLGNQYKTRPVEYRVVQDALACSSIIGSQGIELFREFAMPKFSVEPVEEQFQQSILSLTSEQMPEGLPSGQASNKRVLFHVAKK